MRLKSPQFWYKPKSFGGMALSLFTPFYLAGHRIYQKANKAYKADIPVLCIGNVVVGGSGKTPCALSIMSVIRSEHIARRPCFLSRGYKGTEEGPLTVDRAKHKAASVGDEPLLLADRAPTIISADRKKGAQYIEERDFDLIVMDDGLQNPGLFKDIKLIVISGTDGFGNGKLLPAGPLREPLPCAIKRADGFILIGKDKQNVRAMLPADKPVFAASLVVPDSWVANTNTPYVAFSGLARPDKFKASLEGKGLNIVSWHTYPDHHPYAEAELAELKAIAEQKKARLITTAKDAVRIPHSFMKSSPIDILPIETKWEDQAALGKFLKERLCDKSATS